MRSPPWSWVATTNKETSDLREAAQRADPGPEGEVEHLLFEAPERQGRGAGGGRGPPHEGAPGLPDLVKRFPHRHGSGHARQPPPPGAPLHKSLSGIILASPLWALSHSGPMTHTSYPPRTAPIPRWSSFLYPLIAASAAAMPLFLVLRPSAPLPLPAPPSSPPSILAPPAARSPPRRSPRSLSPTTDLLLLLRRNRQSRPLVIRVYLPALHAHLHLSQPGSP